MNAKTKSPLKDRPLRYVAQSVDEAIDDLLNDNVLFYWIGFCIFGIVIANEWVYMSLKPKNLLQANKRQGNDQL